MAEPVKPSFPPPPDDLATKIAVAVAEAVSSANAKQFGPKDHYVPPRPRPPLNGEFYLSGGPLKPNTLTDEEIHALNRITKQGKYHNGQWLVRIREDFDGKRVTTIDVPCKTVDQRMALPPSLIGILSEIEAEAAKAK
jgi:hypothetical protein